MEKFELRPGEILVVNDPHAVWMQMELKGIEGQLKLTGKRLVFVKDPVPNSGLLRLFIKSMRAHVLLEFPLDKIKSVERVQFGKSTRLVIDNGIDRPRQFVSSKAETMEFELRRLMKKQFPDQE
jgi:hypothetical protein